MQETFYRPGLVFKAHEKAQGHQECCRREVEPVYTPDGAGIVHQAIPALWAEFGVYGGEFSYIDPLTDKTEIGSEFRGGWFNLDEQAASKGWSDVEREIVAREMLTRSASGRFLFSLWTRPPAARPWPKYDEAHHKSIPSLAEQLGLVAEALAYERDTKNRAEVVERLEQTLAEQQQAAVADEELTAA